MRLQRKLSAGENMYICEEKKNISQNIGDGDVKWMGFWLTAVRILSQSDK